MEAGNEGMAIWVMSSAGKLPHAKVKGRHRNKDSPEGQFTPEQMYLITSDAEPNTPTLGSPARHTTVTGSCIVTLGRSCPCPSASKDFCNSEGSIVRLLSLSRVHKFSAPTTSRQAAATSDNFSMIDLELASYPGSLCTPFTCKSV